MAASKKSTSTRKKKSTEIGVSKVTPKPKKRASKVTALPSDKTDVVSTPQKKSSRQRKTSQKKTKSVPSPFPIVPEEKKQDPLTVTLPSNAPLRTQVKALALAELWVTRMQQPMTYVAFVSAACFIFVAVAIFTQFHVTAGNQLAQLSGSTSSSSDAGTVLNTGATSSGSNTTDPIKQTTTTIKPLAPTFVLLDPVPQELLSDVRVALSVTNASKVTVGVKSVDTAATFDIPVERITNESYRFTLVQSMFKAGYYDIKVFATASDGSGVYSYPAGSFKVPEPRLVETVTQPVTTTPTTTVTTTTTNDTKTSTTSSQASNDEVQKSTATTTDTAIKTTEISTDPITTPTTQPSNETPFVVVVSPNALKEQVPVRIYAPETHKDLQLFLRPTLSTQERYLGSPQTSLNSWLYSFDTRNVPNGTYQLFAVARVGTQKISSKAVTISVYNQVKTETVPVVKTASTTQTTEVRNFYTLENSNTFVQPVVVNPAVETETEQLLQEHKDDVNDLLKKYAVAVQSGNGVMQEAVKRDFELQREYLLKKALESGNTTDIAQQIDDSIQARLSELKERVDSFENLRTTRTATNISADRDMDGISDFDEIEVYGTDPNNPDTDNDGFVDGAEVVRGFNPTDATPEVPVEFELPQTVIGLERTDVLAVKAVIPVIDTDKTSVKPIQAEIAGTGLPNSFVTLYIFSTPTIVTIKTDEDGSFVYTFDKELEDGEHEVYVAFTDNTGSILAHSAPFRFVKEAQAFTPVGSTEETLITTDSVEVLSKQQQLNTVVGFGVLAFGIILLMLGMGMRPLKQPLA